MAVAGKRYEGFHVIRTMLGAVTLSGVMVLSGCGGGDENMTRDEQVAQLLQRPDIDQIVTQYEQMRQEIAAQLSSELGLPSWEINEIRGSEAGCGRSFPDVGLDGGIRSLKTLISKAQLADGKWGRALEIAAVAAGRNGFGPAQTIVDRPGQHNAEFHDSYGGRLTLGTQINTTLSVRTGCHLKPEAHQRSTPATRPENGR